VEGVVKRARKTIKGTLQDGERDESRMVGRGGGGIKTKRRGGRREGGKEGRKERGRRSIRPRLRGRRGT
jgi:hypothetical protein